MKIDSKCPYCERDDWREEPIFKVLNPNGEYVQGYGCAPVPVQVGTDYRCPGCGYRLGDEVKHVTLGDNVVCFGV